MDTHNVHNIFFAWHQTWGRGDVSPGSRLSSPESVSENRSLSILPQNSSSVGNSELDLPLFLAMYKTPTYMVLQMITKYRRLTICPLSKSVCQSTSSVIASGLPTLNAVALPTSTVPPIILAVFLSVSSDKHGRREVSSLL